MLNTVGGINAAHKAVEGAKRQIAVAIYGRR